MSWNYENFIKEKLTLIARSEEDLQDLDIDVSEEQIFSKTDHPYIKNKIYIVIKYLASNLSYDSKTQPVQIIALSEENGLDKISKLLKIFTDTYNFNVVIDGTTFCRQQYNSPVVISNFNKIGVGQRSMLYVAGTLVIMENVCLVKNLEVDGVGIKPLSLSLNYSMSGNTQPVRSENLASTEKNIATVSLSFQIVLLGSNFATKILEIANGENSGNQVFSVEFLIGDVEFEYDMKLTQAIVNDAPNQVPSLQVSFMR